MQFITLIRASLNGWDDETWLEMMTSSQLAATTAPLLIINVKMKQRIGPDKSNWWNQAHLLDSWDQGQDSIDHRAYSKLFNCPRRSRSEMRGTRLIDLDIQDRSWNSEDFVKPTQPCDRPSTFKIKVKILKIIKPTQSLNRSNVQDRGLISELSTKLTQNWSRLVLRR